MKLITLLLAVSVLTACASSTYKYSSYCNGEIPNESCANKKKGSKIAVFFDGTGNTPSDNTNVYRLYNIINSQNIQNTKSMYIEGVGTEWYRIISGSLFGNGLNPRLENSYKYILENYHNDKNNELYLFGFSRGAYNARILAGLLYIAGLPDVSSLDEDEVEELIEDIVDVYKTKGDFKFKKEKILALDNFKPSSIDVKVKFIGLWDTVSATSIQLNNEDLLGKESKTYVDQICNIEKAAHAISVDDNRGKRFTPELMTFPSLVNNCGIENSNKVGEFIANKVDEVWFSGAHSDIGGGYADENTPSLSGVSLNWMMRKLSALEGSILPAHESVPENIHAESHIGEESLPLDLYLNWNRNIPEYLKIVHPRLSTLRVHSSVIARLKQTPRTYREFAWVPDEVSTTTNFKDCFDKIELPEGALKRDTTKANYTLEYSPKKGASCFQLEEKGMYESN